MSSRDARREGSEVLWSVMDTNAHLDTETHRAEFACVVISLILGKYLPRCFKHAMTQSLRHEDIDARNDA